MTHTRVARRPVLSRDGSVLAVGSGRTLVRAALPSGGTSSRELPHAAEEVAVGEDGVRVAVSGDDALSLVSVAGQPATVTVPVRILRVAVDGELVAALAAADDRTELRAWRGETLEPICEGLDLGTLAPDGLLADGARDRVVLWGLAGPNAFLGVGDATAVMVEIGDEGPSIVWRGEDALPSFNGLLFPLAQGGLGAYARDELVLLAPGASGWRRVASHALSNLEAAVASPDGSLVAWSWSSYEEESEQELGHIRVARLADGLVQREVAFSPGGTFSDFAVDNDGVVTLAASAGPDRIVVSVADGDALAPRLELTVGTAGAARETRLG